MKFPTISNKNIIASVVIFMIITPLLFTAFVYKNDKQIKQESSGKYVRIGTDSTSYTMDLENFIPYIILKQLPYDSQDNLVIAQSVVVRTWILKQMNGAECIDADDIGLPYYTHDEIKHIWFEKYKAENADTLNGAIANITGIGANDLFDKKMGHLRKLIKEARGCVMSVEGQLVNPLFCNCTNGVSREGASELGEGYSYSKSVVCNDDKGVKKTYTFSVTALVKKLKKSNTIIYKNNNEIDISKLTASQFLNMIEVKKDDLGYVEVVKIEDTVIEGFSFAKAIGIDGADWDIVLDGEKLVFNVKCVGHGFGMSLNQSKILAENGYSWEKILQKFYEVDIVEAY